MKIEKAQVRCSVKNVKEFFGIAASADGKIIANQKSENQMGKASGKRNILGEFSNSNIWKTIIDFETHRENACSVLVGINGGNAKQIVKGINRPYLIISAQDLNYKNFSKQLGRTMLEPTCVVCIETDGVEVNGSKRLIRLLKSTKDLFDSRVCVVLSLSVDSSDMYTDYIEKVFDFNPNSNMSAPAPNECNPKEEPRDYIKKIKEAEEKSDNLSKENNFLNEQYSVCLKRVGELAEQLKSEVLSKEKLEDENNALRRKLDILKGSDSIDEENDRLQSKVNSLQIELNGKVQENSDLVNELRKLQYDSKTAEIEHKTALDTMKEKYEIQCKETDDLRRELSSLKLTEGSKQASTENPRSEEINEKSDLSIIRDRLIKHGQSSSTSAVLRVAKSIKNFRYDQPIFETDEKTNTTKCWVTISRGKIIMNYPELTKWYGEGIDETSAKENAFNKLILSIVNPEME